MHCEILRGSSDVILVRFCPCCFESETLLGTGAAQQKESIFLRLQLELQVPQKGRDACSQRLLRPQVQRRTESSESRSG